jgi:ferritin
MIKNNVQQGINDQIKEELASAYVYLAMSAYLDRTGFKGMATWMRHQADEERGHAMRLFDFLIDRGGTVELQVIPAPPTEWDSPLDVFEGALAHEQKVTALIHDLYALAVKEADPALQVELQWFITEQVEEEATAGEIVDQLRLAGNQGALLLVLDRELGQRGDGEGGIAGD